MSERLKVIREKTVFDVLEKFERDGTHDNPDVISVFKSFLKVAKG